VGAAQPQLQGGFFEAIAAVTSLRELNIGNWMPDRDGGDKADAAECLAPLGALSQLTALQVAMLHGSAAASLPQLPSLRVRVSSSTRADRTRMSLAGEPSHPAEVHIMQDHRRALSHTARPEVRFCGVCASC